jgi:acyl-CoA synthetase (AMP-forming)/AMP-acid ligase II/acyl carrier protein
MFEQTETWLVLSRLVGVLPLSDGRFVAAHILGRSRAVGDEAVASLLEWFSVPHKAGELCAPAGAPHDMLDQVIDQLRIASILRPAGHREHEQIQSFYRKQLREPGPAMHADPFTSTSHPRWLSSEGGSAPAALAQMPDVDTTLVLSSALAVLSLDDHELLVTHPLHTPVHMTRELWGLAKVFERPTHIADALVEFLAAGLSEQEALHVCACLRRWFLLWTSREAETAQAHEIVGPANGSSLRVEYPTEGRWRQKFAPYTLQDVKRCHAAGSVALIGPCHLQLAGEALQVIAQRRGIFLDIIGMLDVADRRLHGARWSVVVLSATQFAASLYEALAAEDIHRAEYLALAIASRVDEAIDRIRQESSAPLLVTSISPPGLSPAGPESPFWHTSTAILARLNAEISARLARLGNAWLVDESRLAAESSPGIYWDDEFNALPHHSAVSSWSWLVMKPGVVGQAAVDERPVPSSTQVDPAYVLGSAIVHAVERFYVENPVKLIVFEPNELLWRGRLEDRPLAYPTPPHFYADVEDYFYAGIHEALSVLRGRGMALACASSCPAADLHDRWKSSSTLKHIVRPEDLVAIEGGGSWPERLQALKRIPVDEAQVLVIAFPPPELRGFRGRIYAGQPHALRRYLLRAPALNPLGQVEQVHTAPSPQGFHDRQVAVEAHSAILENEFHRVVAGLLRVSSAAVRQCKDLRFLGLDSLGAVDLMCELEAHFGVSFEDHQMVEPVVYFPQPLLEALRDALQSKSQTRRPSRSARADCYAGRSYDEWCSSNLASILAEHIKSPQVPWIFKIIESSAPFDARFLSWKELGERANGYAAACAAAGASAGDRVAIAIPFGTELIGAFVGAVLARYIPCIFPPVPMPQESLHDVLANVRPKLVVCEAQRAAESAAELRSAGFAGDIITGQTARDLEWPSSGAPGAPLLLQQSSGTTGSRKVVQLDDRRVLSQVWQIAHAVECSPRDRLATWLPMYHDMGFICTLVLPLALSLPTMVISPFEWVRQPHLLLREISDEKATLTWMPNFALALSARRIDERDLVGLDLSTLRLLVNGGEPVTISAMTAFRQRLAPYGLRASALTSGYGAAEATAAITQSLAGRSPVTLRVHARVLEEEERVQLAGPELPEDEVRELVSSGQVLSHTCIRIADRNGRSLEDAQVGEIVVSGDAVAAQYESDPASSAKAFRNGEFYTGDLGFRIGEEVFITGRMVDLIVLAGRKLYPHDLEETAGEVDGIHPGRVVAIGVPTQDGSTHRLVVLAEPHLKGLTAEEEESLGVAVSARLFERWRVAAMVQIVPRGSLIKTSSGKPSRGRNRALYLQRMLANATAHA